MSTTSLDRSNNPAGVRGKDDERKLFVGGLPRQCSEKEIRDAFIQFGEIESVNIKIDPYTNVSRGFAFVLYTEPRMVEKALHADVSIQGKKVDPRRVTKTPGKIFVGGITSELNDVKIREYFEQYGKITEIQWPYDRFKNQRRAYCFLSFETKETVDELLKRPKQTVHGVELDIKRVKFNPDTMWTGYTRPARGWAPYPYQAGYGSIDYREDYGYDEYYGVDPNDPYYDCYATGFETYPSYQAPPIYPQRAPRGGRAPGGYARHAPY